MKLPKLQELLNFSSKRFYKNRLTDLEHERDQLDIQILELIERREKVEEQILHVENVLNIEK